MSCQSLKFNNTAIQSLLTDGVFKTRADPLKYVEFVSDDQELRKALVQSVKQGQTRPLIRYKSHISAASGVGVPARLARLESQWKLLQLAAG